MCLTPICYITIIVLHPSKAKCGVLDFEIYKNSDSLMSTFENSRCRPRNYFGTLPLHTSTFYIIVMWHQFINKHVQSCMFCVKTYHAN